ncbi:YihY/virulence factor BrkB family protein [Actimicrobium antarcticum]|uniref:Uncharacterized protein n=1 Tax=Actimicrobium antarcticum TaxID=1051899 RepID=A0ABP7T3U1_9BURK
MKSAVPTSPANGAPPRLQLRDVVLLAKTTFTSWLDDYAPSMGAALAYYTVFSIAPLLLIVISLAGLVFGAEAVRGEIVGQLSGLMGRSGAQVIESLLQSASKPSESITGTLFGIALLLVGATTVFGELQDAMDRIWRAPQRQVSGGLLRLLRTRLLSFGMILGIGFLLMISLVFSAALAALGRWWGPLFAEWVLLANLLDIVLGFGLTTAVFALIYKLMPRVSVGWRDVIIGALVTAFLFTLGKRLISLYIGTSGVTSAFGAAGSLVVVLVWVYYSAQIFLLGAEFTWAYAHLRGSRRPPPHGADNTNDGPADRLHDALSKMPSDIPLATLQDGNEDPLSGIDQLPPLHAAKRRR